MVPEGAAEFRLHPQEVKPGLCFSGLFIGLKRDGCQMSQGARSGLWGRLGIAFGEMTFISEN